MISPRWRPWWEPEDLSRPRHVRHYLYLPDEAVTRQVANSEADSGWSVTVREPLSGRSEWLALFEQADYVLTPEAVMGDRTYFRDLADRFAGEYDGWEASV